MAEPVLDRADVQSLVVRGHATLSAACYLLVRVDEPPGARAWLGRIVDEVDDGATRATSSALNLAVTASGLRKLGLPAETVARFSREFVDGMTTEHRRRILGDVGDSAPEAWEWGGPGQDDVDLLVLLYASDESRLTAELDRHRSGFAQAGLHLVHMLPASPLVDREHFGFRDGISQPSVAGFGPGSSDRPIATGEVVLGHRNGYGQFTPRPLLDPSADPQALLAPAADDRGKRDLGYGGSFLVFRQLGQDVRAFWEFCDRETRTGGGSDPAARVRLASRMVGRWPSGAPLVLAPDQDRPYLADRNDFGYAAADPDGLSCPLGAHVRRSNPRDSLPPEPGSDRSVEVANRHRLLRRGRQYGRALDTPGLFAMTAPETWDDEPRGLHFVCLVSNISRQFEFVQHTWLNNPRFHGLYDDPDPVVGAPSSGPGTFTVPNRPVRRRYRGLPRFVSVRGGGYFFLPGLRTLRWLATLDGPATDVLSG